MAQGVTAPLGFSLLELYRICGYFRSTPPSPVDGSKRTRRCSTAFPPRSADGAAAIAHAVDAAAFAIVRPPAARSVVWHRRPMGDARASLPTPAGRRLGTWVYVAGRGAGKTRAGAEWVHARMTAGCRRLAMVAPTAADARDVMVEGESGVLAVAHRYGVHLRYEPSKRRVTWPTGGVASTYSAEEPDRLRGPQHKAAYCDELAAWERGDDTWSNLLFGLRLGPDPRVLGHEPRAR